MCLCLLPCPINLRVLWGFGSMLGLCLANQLVRGILLALYYVPLSNAAFQSVIYICRDVRLGWLIRRLHRYGATFFFACIFIHIIRGLYYQSYHKKIVWLSGSVLFLFLAMIAFTGYRLPWGQMSYWGATVITNILTVVPGNVGNSLVELVRGDYVVRAATLSRFYVFHVIAPFALAVIRVLHIVLLHERGSGNPAGLDEERETVPFHPYYTIKDIVYAVILCTLLIYVCVSDPFLLKEPLNFMPANPMRTPIHIQPEWYFLFAYTLLRRTPDKMLGVVVIILSIAIVFTFPFINRGCWRGLQYMPLLQAIFFLWVINAAVLTRCGAITADAPVNTVGVFCGFIHFFLLYMIHTLSNIFYYTLAALTKGGKYRLILPTPRDLREIIKEVGQFLKTLLHLQKCEGKLKRLVNWWFTRKMSLSSLIGK